MLLTDFELGQVLFEAVSAFATVGLSTGITAHLPVAGQLILIGLMFVGRLGPITFASALALREQRLPYELPKERPIIG
jgi:Trk-type K+ transport system membrane component